MIEYNELREYKRKVVYFKDFDRFKLLERKYDNNSLNIYTARLNDLRKEILRKARLKWGKSYIYTDILSQFNVCLYYCLLHMYLVDCPYVEISQLAVKDKEKSYILVGVLYKDDLKEKLKLSLLRDIDNEPHQETQINEDYTSTYIKIFLEDETLRIRLVGNHIDMQEIITGVVCAVYGHETETGAFWVYIHIIRVTIKDSFFIMPTNLST